MLHWRVGCSSAWRFCSPRLWRFRRKTRRSFRHTENWNVYFQATSIGQYHGTFDAAYSGPLSLVNHHEAEASLTSTLFLGLRPARDTVIYFDPEMAGGRGFSGLNGLANSSNGEMPRVATATPKPYLARLYVTQDFALGDEREAVESDENQLAGTPPRETLLHHRGPFHRHRFFRQQPLLPRSAHPVHGLGRDVQRRLGLSRRHARLHVGMGSRVAHAPLVLRYASAAMPKVANGLRFDRRLLRDRGDVLKASGASSRAGTRAQSAQLAYQNHADMGTYADALRLAAQTGAAPDVIATRRVGTLKYGFGVSADQELTSDIGIFGRWGWNDGKTESFAFTAMDRLVEGGVSITGRRWKRPHDTVATEINSAAWRASTRSTWRAAASTI